MLRKEDREKLEISRIITQILNKFHRCIHNQIKHLNKEFCKVALTISQITPS